MGKIKDTASNTLYGSMRTDANKSYEIGIANNNI